MIRFICWSKTSDPLKLSITIERGWWIFNWIETYHGSISAGWHKRPNNAPASANTTIFLDRHAFKYWEQWI